ncbi:hypothetical protein CCACVL1_29133, partial [Corchorus capsularis]
VSQVFRALILSFQVGQDVLPQVQS